MTRLSAPGLVCGLYSLLAAGSASAAVDPALLKLVMPEAKGLYGIQVQQVLAAPFGKALNAIEIPNSNGLAQFAAATGFDFHRDLTEIVVAMNEAGAGRPPALILVRGEFQADRLLALAAITGATITNYKGTQLIAPPENTMPSSIALIDASTVAIGPYAELERLVDRREGHVDFNGPLALKAVAASENREAWFATVTPLSQFSSNIRNQTAATLAQTVLESAGGIHFDTDNVTITADALTQSEKDAHSLGDMVKLLVLILQSGKNAQTLQGAALFKNMQFLTTGATLKITLSVPEQQMEQLVPRSLAPKKVAAGAQ